MYKRQLFNIVMMVKTGQRSQVADLHRLMILHGTVPIGLLLERKLLQFNIVMMGVFGQKLQVGDLVPME